MSCTWTCTALRIPAELEFLGLADLYEWQTLLLVEWPEHGRATVCQPADVELFLEHAGEQDGCQL